MGKKTPAKGKTTKRRRGRPSAEEKPLSPAEKAQRKTAAFKHGLYAKDPLVRAAGPCSKTHCPLDFPCDARQLAEERGEALTFCAVNAVADDGGATLEKVRQAFAVGDLATLQRDLTAPLVALQFRLARHELERLLGQGGMTRLQPVFGREGQVGDVLVVDPGVKALLATLKNLGATMDAQGATPTSKATRERDIAAAQVLPSCLSELTLDLGGSQVNSLEGLPPSLSELTLRLALSEVSSLKGLPPDLSELTLDLSLSEVSSLEGLPVGLSELTLDLSNSQVRSLEGLPVGLSELTLDIGGLLPIRSPVRSLEGLSPGLSQLTLNLSNSQVSSLECLPPSLSELTLDLRDSQVSSLVGIPPNATVDLSF